MVVVYLDAYAALIAVEAPWRPNDLTSLTVAQLVVFVILNRDRVSWILVFVLLQTEELFHKWLLLVKVRLLTIEGKVFEFLLWQFLDTFRNLFITG